MAWGSRQLLQGLPRNAIRPQPVGLIWLAPEGLPLILQRQLDLEFWMSNLDAETGLYPNDVAEHGYSATRDAWKSKHLKQHGRRSSLSRTIAWRRAQVSAQPLKRSRTCAWSP